MEYFACVFDAVLWGGFFVAILYFYWGILKRKE